MLEWMRDERVTVHYRKDFSVMTLENVRAFIVGSFNAKNRHFAVVNATDEYLGTISLKNINAVDANAEYAIVIRGKMHCQGVGAKATYLILKYAFEELKLHRVYLNVLRNNQAAEKMYIKCGFIYEGTFREHIRTASGYHDLAWYGLTEDDFYKRYYCDNEVR